jgi:hypothetical protein
MEFSSDEGESSSSSTLRPHGDGSDKALLDRSSVSIALLPETLVEKRLIRGVIVEKEIAAFFGKEDDIKLGSRKVIEARLIDGKRIIIEGETKEIPVVIVLPTVGTGRRLVCKKLMTSDEFVDGLSLYSRSKKDAPTDKKGMEEVGPQVMDFRVPELFVRFCKVTSLASHAATVGDDIYWSQVSMTMAIRARPITSRIGRRVDTLLGLIALLIVSQYWRLLASIVDAQLAFEDRTLKERVEFVMSKHAPLGFKLNPQADFVLGNLVILVVDAWWRLSSYPTSYGKEVVIAATTFAALFNQGIGVSVLFAVAFDLFVLLSTHVGVLHRVISRILRFQLGLIGSLALLMRGKKRNMLRHRVDTLKTDSAQLMLGTMAIFFFSFTLQTTLAYHMLVLAVWSLVFIIQCTLFFICVVLRTLPIDELLIALDDRKTRGRFGSRNPLRFKLVVDEKLGLWRVEIIPVSVGDVLANWVKRISKYWTKAWTRRWSSQKVFQNVLRGHELPVVPPPDFK